MPIVRHNPADLFPPYRCYSHATEIRGDARMLFISGLNGYHADGTTMPESFEDQGDFVWQHIGAALRAADMDYRDLVLVRTFLSSPSYDEANVLRVKYLGAHRPSLTRCLLPVAGSALEARDRSRGCEMIRQEDMR